MITCRCGEIFSNYYGDASATCPKCGRTYINMAPDMVEPKTAGEMDWICPACKTRNPCFRGGLVTHKCISCGELRPGSFNEWIKY